MSEVYSGKFHFPSYNTFWDMNYFPPISVKSSQTTDRPQTEKDLHRWAKKLSNKKYKNGTVMEIFSEIRSDLHDVSCIKCQAIHNWLLGTCFSLEPFLAVK